MFAAVERTPACASLAAACTPAGDAAAAAVEVEVLLAVAMAPPRSPLLCQVELIVQHKRVVLLMLYRPSHLIALEVVLTRR